MNPSGDFVGLTLRRAALFLGAALIVITAHDLLLRSLRGLEGSYGAKAQLEGSALLALCVLPGALAGFWRYREVSMPWQLICLMAAAYMAVFLGFATFTDALPVAPKRILALAVIFLGPFIAIAAGTRIRTT